MADPDLPGDRRPGVGEDPRGGARGARPADRGRTSPTRCRTRCARSVTSRRAGRRCAACTCRRREEDWRKGQARLRYEEAFVLQAELARRRAHAQREESTARPARPGGLLEAFDARLPFDLTDGPGRGRGADRRRPRPTAPDAAAAPGRGRLGQDRRGAARDAAGGRRGRAGGAAGAHVGARRAARPHAARAARATWPRAACSAARRSAPGWRCSPGAQAAAERRSQPARGGERSGGDRRRHARAAVGPGAVRGPRARGHRRAAQVRRRAARAGCRPRPRTPRTCW